MENVVAIKKSEANVFEEYLVRKEMLWLNYAGKI